MRISRYLLAVAALWPAQIEIARCGEQVDLLLALAMDVSRSIDQSKFQMQREGYAAAISNPQVLAATPEDCHLLHRLVWTRPGAAPDRLERCRRTFSGPTFR
jgi:hypothetical protein